MYVKTNQTRCNQQGRKKKEEKKRSGFNTTLFPGGPPPQYWAGSNRVNFGVRMRTGALRLIWSNPTERRTHSTTIHVHNAKMNTETKKLQLCTCTKQSRETKGNIIIKKKNGFNTTLFPGGPPPQYWAGSNRVNFGVRMRTGALRLIWSNPTEERTHKTYMYN